MGSSPAAPATHFISYVKSIDRVWLITWAFIYVGFLFLHAIAPGFWGVTVLKYGGIVLNLVYAYQKFRTDYTLIIALAFTLLADTLLVLDNTSIIGIFVFCLAQFFHLARFAKAKPWIFFVYFTGVIAVFFWTIWQNSPPIYAMATIYAATLAANFRLAHIWYKKSPSVASRCAFYGFLLFICCDTNVALSYLSSIAIIPVFLKPIADYFAWFFYYPSQLFIANSSTKLTRKVVKSTQSVIQ